jgi:hypothetical protein
VVVWPGESALRLMEAISFFVIRKNLVQTTLSMLFAFVSVSALESLEFWLEGR